MFKNKLTDKNNKLLFEDKINNQNNEPLFEGEVASLNNEQLLAIMGCKTIRQAQAILNKNAYISLYTIRQRALERCKLGQKKSESTLFAISASNIPIDILAYILTTSLTFAEIVMLSVAGLLLFGVFLVGSFAYNHLRVDQKRESILDNLSLNYLKLAACQAFKKNIIKEFPQLTEYSYPRPERGLEKPLSMRDKILSKITRPAVQAVGLGVTAGVALFLSYFFSSTVIIASLGVGTIALAAAGGPLFFGVMACCFLLAGLLAYRYYQTLKPWKAIKEDTKILEASVSDSRVECASLNIAAKYEKEKQVSKSSDNEKVPPFDIKEAELPSLSTNRLSFYGNSSPSESQESTRQSLFVTPFSEEDQIPLLLSDFKSRVHQRIKSV